MKIPLVVDALVTPSARVIPSAARDLGCITRGLPLGMHARSLAALGMTVLALSTSCVPSATVAGTGCPDRLHPVDGATGGGLLCALDDSVQLSAEGPRKPNEWPVYGGDAGGLKYSPLTSIDRSNV